MRPAVVRRWIAAAAAMMLSFGLVLPAVAFIPPGGLPARVAVITPPVSTQSYPGIDYGRKADAKDDRAARTSWRVVERTGNCCENYLTITPGGRLLDFGGSFINYSDDRGLTWRQVQPLTPLINGEGSIVAAPGGDVLGIGWDPYSGDHLQSYKFEADTQSWSYTEMPIHEPFYDREWLSVVPGPITIDGQTYDYVSFLKGGVPKEQWFYSTDGLHYTGVTSKAAEQMLSGATTQGPLPAAAAADNDWVQANTNGGMTSLGAGEMLASPDFGGDWALLDGDTFGWSAYTLPDGSQPAGDFQVDSLGRVHNVVASSDGASFDYRMSADGGSTWQTTTATLPDGLAIEQFDFRANAAAGVAAVAIHASQQGTDNDQDLLFKLDIAGTSPRVTRLSFLGLGDAGSTSGVGNDVRMDFQTVAIFPDGRVALSFLDSTTGGLNAAGAERITPAVAIELDTTLGGRIRPEPEVTPVLGEAYAGYTFDTSDEGWVASGVPTWTRQQPGTKTGVDDAAGFSFAINGPTEYIDRMDSALTSPAITTQAGLAVVEFWLRTDTEPGFDYVHVEWRAGDGGWQPLASFSGENADAPNWSKVTLGFESPGGPVQVRFRYTADDFCSAADPVLCGGEYSGARIDEVVVGKQAP
jgi:hypothetical protein